MSVDFREIYRRALRRVEEAKKAHQNRRTLTSARQDPFEELRRQMLYSGLAATSAPPTTSGSALQDAILRCVGAEKVTWTDMMLRIEKWLGEERCGELLDMLETQAATAEAFRDDREQDQRSAQQTALQLQQIQQQQLALAQRLGNVGVMNVTPPPAHGLIQQLLGIGHPK